MPGAQEFRKPVWGLSTSGADGAKPSLDAGFVPSAEPVPTPDLSRDGRFETPGDKARSAIKVPRSSSARVPRGEV
jgi:hypothetical protein